MCIKWIEFFMFVLIVFVSVEEIKCFGMFDLGSIFVEFFVIVVGFILIGNNNSNVNVGLSLLDLCFFGENRIFIFVNGKWYVVGLLFFNVVDIGFIFVVMIEWIEVIIGGVLVIYGFDVVLGVINVIFRDDYEGFEFRFDGIIDLEGVGNRINNFSVLYGYIIDDGKGNIIFFVEKNNIN